MAFPGQNAAQNTLLYLIHHVFLPPQVPYKSDYDPGNERVMLEMVLESLASFRYITPSHRHEAVDSAVTMLQRMADAHICGGGSFAIDADELTRVMQQLVKEGGSVILHVSAQNAGILISSVEHCVVFEVFEVSPLNSHVVSTKGRLSRTFPSSGISLPRETVREASFREAFAATVSTMSQQSVPGTQPRAKKAAKMHDEERDTTDPKMVTEFLMSVLAPLGTPATTCSIWKQTRDEVYYQSSLQPWRRSPVWLVIRVGLQLCFRRFIDKNATDLYKEFMTFHMARILEQARRYDYHSDLILAMKAKIVQRLRKMDDKTDAVRERVRAILRETDKILEDRWEHIQETDTSAPDIARLGKLDPKNDTLVRIPGLDQFIRGIATRSSADIRRHFQPSFGLQEMSSHELPSLQADSGECLSFKLMALETWIASDLSTWLEVNKYHPDTCRRLRELTETYYRLGKAQYSDFPESMSLMILTVLELWVACDQAAISACPLLCQYDPGIPIELLQSLLLPLKSQMERLCRVENYLVLRATESKHDTKDVLGAFGSANSFSVRWFRQSSRQQRLKAEIERWATECREEKRQEFRTKRDQYKSLMRLHGSGDHQMTSEWSEQVEEYVQKHLPEHCNKCSYLQQAQSISIEIHEWPLPHETLKAQSTVFELMVPDAFGHWRDMTLFLHSNVLGSGFSNHSAPKSMHTPGDYSGLERFFEPFRTRQRVVALSEIKPQGVDHRRNKKVGKSTEEDVCLRNALRYEYFDNQQECFVDTFNCTDEVEKQCTYQLPAKSSALQQFLHRGPDQPSGPTPNTVIASQSERPDHIQREEYKTLCSLPLGFRIQWHNLLIQLKAPVVDFRRPETTFFVLQCILQAGPRGTHGTLRESHAVVADDAFVLKVLGGLEENLRHIQGNWQASHALFTLISVACRLHSLTETEHCQHGCLKFLARARETGVRWLGDLRQKLSLATDEKENSELYARIVTIALIVSDSFNLHSETLKSLLSSQMAASIFLQCSIIIQEGKGTIKRSQDFTSLLYKRWQRLSYHIFPILAGRIADEGDQSLDVTINQHWPAYQRRSIWKRLPSPYNHWLVNDADEDDPLEMHFNLLDGDLLVNGVPLGRLPSEYEQHDTYSELFGRKTIEVMPTAVTGLRFSGKTTFAGYTLHFGMSSNSDLLVRAEQQGRSYELIPRRLLHLYLPVIFVEEHVHWLDLKEGKVVFCERLDPWKMADRKQALIPFEPDFWRMDIDGKSLIDVNSDTAKLIAEVTQPLEDSMYIHCTLDEATSVMEVDLPRLQLGFFMSLRSEKIYSRQHRGMFIDKDQRLGSLVGLKNKLLLRDDGARSRRMVITTYGSAAVSRSKHHVSVDIDKASATRTYTYEIDNRLGRLIGDGGLISRLWICYLHALTSFCLPDPLIGRTGTEEALSILNSAALRSFDRLTLEAMQILENVSFLSPRRRCYPVHERVMQVVEWDPNLGFLAQHEGFQPAVQRLLDLHIRSQLFYPGSRAEAPTLTGVDRELAERAEIRSSTFRVAGFGAEKFTHKCDVVYPGRDQWKTSDAARRVAAIVKSVRGPEQWSKAHMPEKLADYIWEYLKRHSVVSNDQTPLNILELVYDTEWLSSSGDYISQNWIKLHRTLVSEGAQVNRFHLMAWLGTLAYASNADMPILYTLVSFYNGRSTQGTIFPSGGPFDLSEGTEAREYILSMELKAQGIPFGRSPDATIPRDSERETAKKYRARRERSFSSNQGIALQKLVSALMTQWPCRDLDCLRFEAESHEWSSYFAPANAIAVAQARFRHWYDNARFKEYIGKAAASIPRTRSTLQMYSPSLSVEKRSTRVGKRFVTVDDVFGGPAAVAPLMDPPKMSSLLSRPEVSMGTSSPVEGLVRKLESMATSPYEKGYVDDLKLSLCCLKEQAPGWELQTTVEKIREELKVHTQRYQAHVDKTYAAMLEAVGAPAAKAEGSLRHWPRICPAFFLQQLSHKRWPGLRQDWKDLLIHYGLTLNLLQQAERRLSSCDNKAMLIKELSNSGHTAWDPHMHPESLLLEIESGITIRDVQMQVAQHMSALEGVNQVIQLNMGEGKSSVIVPVLVTILANGHRLIRVFVAKPQAKQMYQMLVSKLGGLLDRPVFQVPFSRSVKLGVSEVDGVQRLFRECMKEGGVLLVQPEHVLSFKLMALERMITGEQDVGRSMLKSLDFLRTTTRDIVDESDENFSVKFELIYTLGTQRPIDHSPGRWVCIQELLDVFRSVIPLVQEELPDSVEVTPSCQGGFPRARILRQDAEHRLVGLVARRVCDYGLGGFPISRYPAPVRAAVHKYITESNLTEVEIKQVQESGFWSESTSPTLLLLRGLLSGRVLAFAFSEKRWRVDYGVVEGRQPPTRLAVPYRAKDSPSPRSEFSHPDIVILLTCLSYYYGGLSNDDIFQAFRHLFKSDQADLEYQAWVKDANHLPEAFQQLSGVNIDDTFQCSNEVFPRLRFAKATIDYFLAHLVFTKEMKEFPYKLSASGWDIAERKSHSTTGFSGTNDSRFILPLGVAQHDLPNQKHTNALVLGYLLRPETSVALMEREEMSKSASRAESLLSMVVSMTPSVRVILDVGAQILELSNLDLARTWLAMLPDDEQTKAVVFFDDQDHACVLDRVGQVEKLHTSPFASQLDTCLVFLDEAHTRGTDLKLPQHYRAAVTLGVGLTKDRLVQACMRMRELGKGQSVTLCTPREIAMKVQACTGRQCVSYLTVADILQWSVAETWRDTSRNIPVWATQGRRYLKHQKRWTDHGFSLSRDDARAFLEDEAQSLEAKYSPLLERGAAASGLDTGGIDDPIAQRCQAVGGLDHRQGTLREEQERELSPEIEREREIQRAPPATPLPHAIHPDIRSFVSTGRIRPKSPAFKPAFKTLSDTQAAVNFDISQLSGKLLVSMDFSRCIRLDDLGRRSTVDCFQRSVQWIMTSQDGSPAEAIQFMVIISPYEVQELLPDIAKSKHTTLHIYSPRPNLGYRPLDSLDLYAVPRRQARHTIPPSLIIELNLFAGQLYFDTFEEYTHVCRVLGAGQFGHDSSSLDGEPMSGEADERCPRQKSPIQFFKTFLTTIRRDCESIDKTHLGSVLSHRLLTADEFSSVAASTVGT